MFKESLNRNRIILFLSSYIPMYLIIIIQNVDSLINNVYSSLSNRGIQFKMLFESKEAIFNSLLFLSVRMEVLVLALFTIISIVSFLSLKKIVSELKSHNNDFFEVNVKSIENLNYQYVLTYFSAYFFPFITMSLSTVAGLLQFLILWGLIGFIYVKNDLIYINPIINIFFGYNIYKAELILQDEDNKIEVTTVLLSKKARHNIEIINVIKESEDLYIEG